MESYEREFKGIWIPKEVYLSPAIGWMGKLIYLEIDSFTSKDRDCFVSNEYLAEKFEISPRQVIRNIVKLKELGWIEQTRFDGKKRYLRTCYNGDFSAVTKTSPLDVTEMSPQQCQNSHPSHDKNVTHTNTNYFNTNTNSFSLSDNKEIAPAENGSFSGIQDAEFTEVPAEVPADNTQGTLQQPDKAPAVRKGRKGGGGGAPKTAKPKDTLYPAMMELYYEWYKARNAGTPPKIDGQEGKGLKAIITYFKTVYNTKDGEKGEQELEVLGMFKYVLGHWEKIDPFHQKQTKLSQINSNITNIIDYLKNGRKETKPTDKSASATASRVEETIRLAREKAGNGQHG